MILREAGEPTNASGTHDVNMGPRRRPHPNPQCADARTSPEATRKARTHPHPEPAFESQQGPKNTEAGLPKPPRQYEHHYAPTSASLFRKM